MGIKDAVLLVIIFTAVVCAVAYMIKHRGACSGKCSGCSCSCCSKYKTKR